MDTEVSTIIVSSLSCPTCGSDDNQVTDTREHLLGQRRRRMCRVCETRWTTIELREGLVTRMANAIELLPANVLRSLRASLRQPRKPGKDTP